jgi:hypothetical protein
MENQLISIPRTEDQAIREYYKLKKLSKRYWNIGAASLTYCTSYAFFHFLMNGSIGNHWMILSSVMAVYLFSPTFERVLVKKFNKADYNIFKVFCMKHGFLDPYI